MDIYVFELGIVFMFGRSGWELMSVRFFFDGCLIFFGFLRYCFVILKFLLILCLMILGEFVVVLGVFCGCGFFLRSIWFLLLRFLFVEVKEEMYLVC